MKQSIDGISSTEQAVRELAAGMDVPRKTAKKTELLNPKSISPEIDMKIMRVIQGAFSELSIRGKGVCLESLIREFAKEKIG